MAGRSCDCLPSARTLTSFYRVQANAHLASQIPQIWADYMPVDTEEVRARRIAGIQTTIADKKAAAAKARQVKIAAAAARKDAEAALAAQHLQDNPRPKRLRKPTARAAVRIAFDCDET